MNTVYIGIDDTDIEGSVGTGRVARELAERLTAAGFGTSLGVSRHQLLVDSRIPYTSHNSSKGLAFKTEATSWEFLHPAVNYLRSCLQNGADPGLCICDDSRLTEEIVEFGIRSQHEVLTKQEAIAVADRDGIFLREIGGTGDGIIGALAAVGLRASGNDGRLVDLKGIKEITGIVTVADILARTGIIAVHDESGRPLLAKETIDSTDWIRPSLVNGQPVLRVKPAKTIKGRTVWQPLEKRNSQNNGGRGADD